MPAAGLGKSTFGRVCGIKKAALWVRLFKLRLVAVSLIQLLDPDQARVQKAVVKGQLYAQLALLVHSLYL